MSPYKVALFLTPANIALLLLFASASFNFLAKYFYLYYRLIFGTLYPSYSSYKAIKHKDFKEYTRWLMYWVCFGIFNVAEFFTDIIFAFWFPFYYELKILFILWLMSPYGNGAKILYKCLIHPELNRRESVIDNYISRTTEFGVKLLIDVWKKASSYINQSLSLSLSALYNLLTTHLQNRNCDSIEVLSEDEINDNLYNNNAIENYLSVENNSKIKKPSKEEIIDLNPNSYSLESLEVKEELEDIDTEDSESLSKVRNSRKKSKQENGSNAQRPKRKAARKARSRFHHYEDKNGK